MYCNPFVELPEEMKLGEAKYFLALHRSPIKNGINRAWITRINKYPPKLRHFDYDTTYLVRESEESYIGKTYSTLPWFHWLYDTLLTLDLDENFNIVNIRRNLIKHPINLDKTTTINSKVILLYAL